MSYSRIINAGTAASSTGPPKTKGFGVVGINSSGEGACTQVCTSRWGRQDQLTGTACDTLLVQPRPGEVTP